MTLRQKTISGVGWSFFDNSLSQVSQFIVGIILARLLTPDVFGIIGMVMIFIGISQAFTEGGLRQALIRKKNCTDDDYNTVFYTSLAISILLYILLFILSPLISTFYNEQSLTKILRILSIYVIIDALGSVQGAILSKNINFKLRSKITFFSTITSGTLSIILAFMGYGVWSLVFKQLLQGLIFIILLWYWSNWRPKLIFSILKLKELVNFSFPLLVTNLLDTIYNYVYYLVIGKFYSARELGFYTRALTFSNLPTTNIIGATDRVAYPLLSALQDDNSQLKEKLKLFIKHIMFITLCLSFFIAASAKSIILVLIGSTWLPSVIYMQLLCFAFALYPINTLNINILKVKGRTDIILKIEFVRKIIAIPIIILAIYHSIILLIVGLIVHSIISFFINTFYTAKMIKYGYKEQIKDIFPAIFISIVIFLFDLALNLLNISSLYLLILQTLTGTLLFIFLSTILNVEEYYSIKELIWVNIKNIINK